MTSIVLATTLTIPFVTLSDDLGTLNNTALQLGGLTKSALQPNELYRLFSAFFLHFSLPHLAVNLFTLGIFLHPVEILIGRAKVINVLLISALGGSVGSIIFSPFEIVAGASGGILGLIASYTVLHFKCREKMIGFVFIPHNVLLLIIVGQIASDLLFDGIDLYSHLFGFLVGAIYTNFASRSGLLPNGTRHNNFACLLSFVLTAIFLVGAVYFGIRCMR
ncbi:rhomboid family intramembrane serine protease [Massilia sp. BKSP1R2A-1]|uniref:rhomboid family intramembrane serine protease n=1 Tax=Massilia sp. BKSP1R2A-1 TaxID=3422595 RepID=UPI003D327272